MEIRTYDCEVITPMFLHGVDGKTPELRAPSIKGAMRFWWRAVQAEEDINVLRVKEAQVFGDSGNEGKSKFSIVVSEGIKSSSCKEFKLLPHHTGDENCPYLENCGDGRTGRLVCTKGQPKQAFIDHKFKIKLMYNKSLNNEYVEYINNLLKLTARLGGLGKRSRRGFGSFTILDQESKNCNDDLRDLLKLLNRVSNSKYFLDGNSIKLHKDCRVNYPFIQEIEIGKAYDKYEKLLRVIGESSHKESRGVSLGYAKGINRLASPIYVSVIKSQDKYRPIITTLKVALSKDIREVDIRQQKSFKEAIL